MKLHIVVPTIMTNPNQEFECIDRLIHQLDYCNLDFKIHFVANFSIPEFEEYVPVDSRIEKSVSNLPFSISRAINSVFERITYDADDIFAFIQSDAFFENPSWILDLIDVICDESLSTGVVGLRPHVSSNPPLPNAVNFKNKFDIYPVHWTDGVMLFKPEVYEAVGSFDENYFGDCESQDFCYHALHYGYVNYWCSDASGYFGYKNKSSDFMQKSRFNRDEFLKKVKQSRDYLRNKWEI